MFVLVLLAALSCAFANPNLLNQQLPTPFNNFHAHVPPSQLNPQVAPEPMATPMVNTNTNVNTNRRGRAWLAETVEPVYKPMWTPTWSSSWSPSWAPTAAWGSSGLYYGAPVTHKYSPWSDWKVESVGWKPEYKPAPHYAAWSQDPVTAKWISGDKWMTDKWTGGWSAPAYHGAQVAPWSAPVVKREWSHWTDVKPTPQVGLYSAEPKPWDVKPVVAFDDVSKPFKYSTSIIHDDKAIAAPTFY